MIEEIMIPRGAPFVQPALSYVAKMGVLWLIIASAVVSGIDVGLEGRGTGAKVLTYDGNVTNLSYNWTVSEIAGYNTPRSISQAHARNYTWFFYGLFGDGKAVELNEKGAYLEFNFTGINFSLIYLTNSDGAIANVTLDGNESGEIDFRTGSGTFTLDNLSLSNHTIRVLHTGQGTGAPYGGFSPPRYFMYAKGFSYYYPPIYPSNISINATSEGKKIMVNYSMIPDGIINLVLNFSVELPHQLPLPPKINITEPPQNVSPPPPPMAPNAPSGGGGGGAVSISRVLTMLPPPAFITVPQNRSENVEVVPIPKFERGIEVTTVIVGGENVE